jgi:beta-lactamase class A
VGLGPAIIVRMKLRTNPRSIIITAPRSIIITAVLLALALTPALSRLFITEGRKEAKPPEITERAKSPKKATPVVAKTEKAEPKVKKAPKQPEELRDKLTQVMDEAPGTYGVYIYDLQTGDSLGINEDTVFPAASTLKVPLLMAVYKEIQEGRLSREAVMTYCEGDYEGGTGSIQYGPFGTEWTVAQLAEKMMKESDNIAKQMFFRLLGYQNVQNFDIGLGFKNADMPGNVTTPKGSAKVLRQLYENKILDGALSREIIDLMVDTEFEARLPRFLPGVRISHKIGTLGTAVSDIGIVYTSQGKAYVIAVYSKDIQNTEDAEETIGAISKMVYDFQIL